MPKHNGLNRRNFLRGAGMTALAGAVGAGTAGTASADNGGLFLIKLDLENKQEILRVIKE